MSSKKKPHRFEAAKEFDAAMRKLVNVDKDKVAKREVEEAHANRARRKK